MRSLAWAAVLVVGFCTGTAVGAGEEGEVGRSVAEFVREWNTPGSAKVLGFWGRGAELRVSGFGEARDLDWAGMSAVWGGPAGRLFQQAKYEATAVRVRMLRADLALVDWDGTLGGLRDVSGRAVGRAAHHVAAVMGKEGEGWVFQWAVVTPRGAGMGVRLAYFTDDDGATWFADDATKVPPFEHNGKQAVRAYVFQCGDGKPFVGMLQRYTAEAKAKLEGSQPALGTRWTKGPDVMEDIEITGLEVKKPRTGDAGWVRQTDPKAGPINRVTCPDGKVEGLRALTPGSE